jgi:hypothetical protein
MMRAYDFWSEKATATSGVSPLSTLTFYPDGQYRGSEVAFRFESDTSVEQQLAIADRVLAGVQAWRDGIAAYATRQRTAEDELAAARARIAELEAQTDSRAAS